ncbi:nucleotide-diphospho-sugar transferase [Pyrenochaeta sp. MPI-SDFR-AT-0127]|nr:nucleotide-diphospho-sugar transferase [Pyrenochaeta sp. MPI-SDFR-AT-0127]
MLGHHRHFLLTICATAALFYSIYCVRWQYAFETFLDNLRITFDDFPPVYAEALNNSVSRHEQPTDFDYSSTFTQVQIPRIIHYIWFKDLYHGRKGATDIPSVGSQSPELCRQHNPSYEIQVWNATRARDFLEAEHEWFLPTYDGYRYPIQRIDALKYFILYHYGGIYMDLDIACRRPLDPLLDFPAWFPEASPLGVNNDLMACTKRHLIMKRMIQSLAKHDRYLLFPYITIFWSTGPQFTSNVLREWYKSRSKEQVAARARGKHKALETFVILPQVFYSEEYTFFGHSPGGTWHGSDVAMVLCHTFRGNSLLC